MAVSDPTGIWDASEPERILHYIATSRWGQEGLPPGGWFGRVSAVLQVPDGRVFVFQRGPASHDVTIFGPDEHAIGGWSAAFGTEHGMRLGPDGHLWLTDVGRHRVLKTTLDGEILLELGTPDTPGCDERTFNAPTDMSFAPDGSVYITDGYGNSRVVHVAPDGTFIRAWGRRGSGPGEFDTPHSVAVAPDGRVLVSDRHNHRIQHFSPEGEYLTEWTHLGATQGLTFGADGDLWAMTHRSISEILSFDSIAGRLAKVDPQTGAVKGWLPTPGHMMTESHTRELWVASLSGTVIKFRPGWVLQGPDGQHETF
jgi:DNA-binding beta-propeller fold protein YncE